MVSGQQGVCVQRGDGQRGRQRVSCPRVAGGISDGLDTGRRSVETGLGALIFGHPFGTSGACSLRSITHREGMADVRSDTRWSERRKRPCRARPGRRFEQPRRCRRAHPRQGPGHRRVHPGLDRGDRALDHRRPDCRGQRRHIPAVAEATNRLDLYEKGGKTLPEIAQGITEKAARSST